MPYLYQHHRPPQSLQEDEARKAAAASRRPFQLDDEQLIKDYSAVDTWQALVGWGVPLDTMLVSAFDFCSCLFFFLFSRELPCFKCSLVVWYRLGDAHESFCNE